MIAEGEGKEGIPARERFDGVHVEMGRICSYGTGAFAVVMSLWKLF